MQQILCTCSCRLTPESSSIWYLLSIHSVVLIDEQRSLLVYLTTFFELMFWFESEVLLVVNRSHSYDLVLLK